MANASADQQRNQVIGLGVLALLVGALIFCYWNSLTATAGFWDNPKYSHGYLVPLFTLLLLWLRNENSNNQPLSEIAYSMRNPMALLNGSGSDGNLSSAISGLGMMVTIVGIVVGCAAAFISSKDPTGAQGVLTSNLWLVSVLCTVIGVLMLINYPINFGNVKLDARLAGFVLLAAGLGIRLLTTHFPNMTPEMGSFVPALAGVFLMVGGWMVLKWAGPAIAFLVFMYPLPSFLDNGLLAPLQRIATIASTYALQTLGLPTYREGNVIYVGELKLGVVDACSGLRMLTIFVALAVAIILVTDRPIWERIIIVLSAVPIALAVNIVRITVTGVLHLTAGSELADKVFHDLAGWVMMPMALGLLYVEFQLLTHLMVDDGPAGPLPVGIAPRAMAQRTTSA